MSWLLLALAVWLAVSLPLALLIVRTIHHADSEAGTSEAARDELYVFHIVRPR
jgi:predicted dienelactone hydrolase